MFNNWKIVFKNVRFMVSYGKVKYLFKLTNNVLLVVKYTWEKRFIDVQVGLDRFWTFLEP